MAIYRKGEASLAADGTVTGYGTNWKDQLALVRIGATIVFLNGNAIGAIGTVSAIVSETQLQTIQSDGAVVARGKYFILLHDSLTVDGLAQNVAETLRYYQSSETEIADALDYFRTFDWDKFEKIAKDVKTNAASAKVSETNAKTSETNAKGSENAAAASKTAAAASQTAAKTSETNAKTSETNAKASENAASGSKTAAAGSATDAAASKTAAAASQAAAKTSETNAKTSETNAKSSENSALQSKNAAAGSATAAKTSETNSKTSETRAKTSETNAASSATKATTEADRAKAEADRAAASNPANSLLKAQNLADVPDKGAGRTNLDVFSKGETQSQIDGLMTQKGLNQTGFISQNNANDIQYNGFFAGAGTDGVNFQRPYAPGLVMRRVNDVYQAQLDDKGRWYARFYTPSLGWGAWTQSLIPGDFGIGTPGTNKPSDWSSSFISDADGGTTWAPTNGAGFQSSYANQRTAQVWVDNSGRIHSRFNMTTSPQATKAASQWRRSLNDIDDAPGFEKAGGNLGTLGLGSAGLRGEGHGVYFQPLSANATQARGYPVQAAGSFRVEQNGANGSNGCVQFYTAYNGIGGTYFRFISPDGANLVPGGVGGWKVILTNNGDVAGGNAPTIRDYNDFTPNHVGFGYGNVPNSTNTGGVVNTISNTKFSDYKSMSCHDYASGRLFFRTFNADSVKSWTAWREVTFAAASDEALKEVKGKMNVNGALDNVCRMDFVLFRYLTDTTEKSARRGVIAQQVRKIDREYTKKVGDHLHLDQTPMLLDGLAAIKALKQRDDENKAKIAKLESDVEDLKAIVAELLKR